MDETIDTADGAHNANTVVNPCDQCLYIDVTTESSYYCEECKENLCTSCFKKHGSMSATKTHKPVPIGQKNKPYCNICIDSEGNIEAITYCNECNEFLCNNCTKVHSTRKATKMHNLDPADSVKVKSFDLKSMFCAVCKLENKLLPAEKFCQECDEYLCGICVVKHKKGKATKDHTPAVFPAGKETEKPEKQKQNCDRCLESDKDASAVKYCNDCGQFLCVRCVEKHRLRKPTQFHNVVNVEEIELKYCDFCLKVNESNQATMFCRDCSEALCNECVREHKNYRETKEHDLKAISRNWFAEDHKICDLCQSKNVTKIANVICENCVMYLCETCKERHSSHSRNKDHIIKKLDLNKDTQSSLCDICLRMESESQAKMFCPVCNEKLCERCTIMHAAQLATKGHGLKHISQAMGNDTEICGPCDYKGAMEYASKFCSKCNEFLCLKCSEFHKGSRSTSKHLLMDMDEVKEKNKRECESCLVSDNLIVDAESFCKNCKEFYCANCVRRHKASKIARNHAILTVTEGISRTVGEDILLCDPCKVQSKEKRAYAFCIECDNELLCNRCSQQHTSHRLTRGHKLSTDFDNLTASDVSLCSSSSPENFSPESKEEVITSDELVPEDLPGQPRASDVKADSVKLAWEKPKVFGDADYYQISYKVQSAQTWSFYQGEYDIGNVDINDLKADTEYVFRVRVVHRDGDGPHSKESETIKTVVSPAAKMVNVCNMVIPGKPSPSVYGVPIKEIPQSRNEVAKTKKFEVGQFRADIVEEKTIMLVGATGTGKSTLVNGLLNYVIGVQWNDPFRFTIVDVTEEERENAAKSQAVSQTEWITCYTINPDRGSRLDYRLNIIDTPGFGDTRGMTRDKMIVDQIRALFTEEGPKGVPFLDAVCFLIKAPDARLTTVQRYIFEQIMTLFGKNVRDNICSLITFADGNDPPVLTALEASKLPFGKHFTFNNSGLFTKNKDLGKLSMSPLFWEMGLKSFKSFFEHLMCMQKKSLYLTVAVLEEREKLENTVQILQPQVEIGLSKLNSFKEEIRIIEQHKTEAKANKNFTYEVEEVEQLKTDLPKGQHVTNCLNCNFTCHKNCKLPNDDQKERCVAMGKDGNCQYCPDKCYWKKHVNSPYIFELKRVKKKKTYKEKLKKYQEAEGKVLNHAQVIGKMKQELEEYTSTIEHFMNEIRLCNEKLSEIALRPNLFSFKEYIELLIKTEKMEQKEGYMERIYMLEEMKNRAQITDKAKRFKDEFKKANKTFASDLRNCDDSEESKWNLKHLIKGLFNIK